MLVVLELIHTAGGELDDLQLSAKWQVPWLSDLADFEAGHILNSTVDCITDLLMYKVQLKYFHYITSFCLDKGRTSQKKWSCSF